MVVIKTKQAVNKPKLKPVLTPELVDIYRQFSTVADKSIAVINNINVKLPHASPTRKLECLRQELEQKHAPLLKQFNDLTSSLNKAGFEAAYGESLKEVLKQAYDGDVNCWLMLLKWDISYLDENKLRELIYHEANMVRISNRSSGLLKEIAAIIANPKNKSGHILILLFEWVDELIDKGIREETRVARHNSVEHLTFYMTFVEDVIFR